MEKTIYKEIAEAVEGIPGASRWLEEAENLGIPAKEILPILVRYVGFGIELGLGQLVQKYQAIPSTPKPDIPGESIEEQYPTIGLSDEIVP